VVRTHPPDLMVSDIRMPAYRPHSQRALAANQSTYKRSTARSVTRLGAGRFEHPITRAHDCLLNYQGPCPLTEAT
jgi:hypothetical protein